MHVEVVDYDPNWSAQFQHIKTELESALQNLPYESIEHVGSTSVPGLCAKPIIDIDVIVTEVNLNKAISAATQPGFYYFVGDQGIPHRYLIRPVDRTTLPKRNIYFCLQGCQSLRNHLAIRDTCRANAEVRDKYGELKRELSKRDWRNLDEYCKAKTEMLVWILGEAGFSRMECEEIAVANGVRAIVAPVNWGTNT